MASEEPLLSKTPSEMVKSLGTSLASSFATEGAGWVGTQIFAFAFGQPDVGAELKKISTQLAEIIELEKTIVEKLAQLQMRVDWLDAVSSTKTAEQIINGHFALIRSFADGRASA